MRKIIVATDKFKGSLTAVEAAQAIKEGILQREPDANIVLMPMADGGEGSLQTMEQALNSSSIGVEKVAVDTVDPLGRKVRAHFLVYPQSSNNREVFIEMAQTSGLGLIPENQRDILRATTYGFGEIIRFAIQECNVRKVTLAIGGSATNDGGFGMLTALGFRFKNTSVFRNKNVPCFLSTVEELNNNSVKDVCPEIDEVEFNVACDVQNPLLGPDGATMIYGPQKGGTPQQLQELESAMDNWARIVQKWYDLSHFDHCPLPAYQVPGTGAAGGVGFALYAVLGAKLIPGWKLFSSVLHLPEQIADADLVITGEGKFDSQSLSGKLPYGLSQICQQYRKPLYVFCGANDLSPSVYQSAGIQKVFSLQDIEPDLNTSIRHATQLITKLGHLAHF